MSFQLFRSASASRRTLVSVSCYPRPNSFYQAANFTPALSRPHLGSRKLLAARLITVLASERSARILKRNVPSTASATDALLRLRPCHRAYRDSAYAGIRV